MHTTHTTLTFADHTLHIVEFDPDSFHEHDMLWLPHHTQLLSSGRKRKAEHLAGRIAAVHALPARFRASTDYSYLYRGSEGKSLMAQARQNQRWYQLFHTMNRRAQP